MQLNKHDQRFHDSSGGSCGLREYILFCSPLYFQISAFSIQKSSEGPGWAECWEVDSRVDEDLLCFRHLLNDSHISLI